MENPLLKNPLLKNPMLRNPLLHQTAGDFFRLFYSRNFYTFYRFFLHHYIIPMPFDMSLTTISQTLLSQAAFLPAAVPLYSIYIVLLRIDYISYTILLRHLRICLIDLLLLLLIFLSFSTYKFHLSQFFRNTMPPYRRLWHGCPVRNFENFV